MSEGAGVRSEAEVGSAARGQAFSCPTRWQPVIRCLFGNGTGLGLGERAASQVAGLKREALASVRLRP